MKPFQLRIVSLLFLLLHCFGYGQTTLSSKNDANNFKQLREKTEQMLSFHPDSAKVYADKLMKMAKDSKSERLLAIALIMKLKTNDSAEDDLELNKKSLAINIKLNAVDEIARNYMLFGVIYLNKADYTNAVYYFNKSLDISKKNKLYTLSKKNYRSLSTLYGLQEDYPKALKNALEALQLEKESPNKIDKAFAHICLADYYDYTGNKTRSNDNYQIAYNLFKEVKNEYNMALTLMNWSVNYEESNPIKSLEMGMEAQKVFDKIAPKSLFAADNLGSLGVGFFTLAKNDSLLKTLSSTQIPKSKNELLSLAENSFQRSLDILKENKNAYGLFYLSGNLSELQAYKSDYKNAYFNLLLSKKLNDSLFSQKNKNAIAKLESEKEVLQLKTLNEKKATLNKILIGSSIVLLLLGFLGYRNFRTKQKLQNLKISELEKDKQLLAIDAMMKGQEEERSRIAKDLHDGLGGLLSGTKLSFTTMKENLILTPENAIQFDKSLSMLDSTMSDLRKVAHNLMPEALVKFGLNEALKDFCYGIQSTKTVSVIYQKLGTDEKYENTTEVFIYRIVQELVNNALKHAQAKEILVQLATHKNSIHITVEDDGIGYDTEAIQTKKGNGLSNIEYRVNYLNGTIDTVSSVNKGTSVNIEFKV
jgi:two-component system, NarL family, sensor kinase